MVTFLENGTSGNVQFLFAHGAGAPMDSPFMDRVAGGIAEKGITVARFEFPYMGARRQGQRKPPDRQAVLLDYWRQAVKERGDMRRIFIGGKSMGGRMATLISDELNVDGVVCFGYPFHPPGKPETLRVTHLAAMKTPTLIVQGVRDALGNQQEVSSYELSSKIDIVWIQDGDHSLKPRKSSGRTEAENLADAISVAAEFMLISKA